MSRIMRFPIVIEREEDGYSAWCPALPGCHSCADTYEELLANMGEAIRAMVEDMEANGETLPTLGFVSLAELEVAV